MLCTGSHGKAGRNDPVRNLMSILLFVAVGFVFYYAPIIGDQNKTLMYTNLLRLSIYSILIIMVYKIYLAFNAMVKEINNEEGLLREFHHRYDSESAFKTIQNMEERTIFWKKHNKVLLPLEFTQTASFLLTLLILIGCFFMHNHTIMNFFGMTEASLTTSSQIAATVNALIGIIVIIIKLHLSFKMNITNEETMEKFTELKKGTADFAKYVGCLPHPERWNLYQY